LAEQVAAGGRQAGEEFGGDSSCSVFGVGEHPAAMRTNSGIIP